MKSTAIVLGGTSPHAELIRRLKKRGFYTILVDYLENPPAKKEADLHLPVSTMDYDAVYDVAKKYNACIVISSCVDQANVTACYVNEKLNLPLPYSFDTASKISNKGYMKKMMKKYGIPTSEYLYLEKGEKLGDFKLKYPIMVKPADACAASGVKKAYTREEAEKYLEDAKRISRNGRAIIEEFVEGDEVSIYSFVNNENVDIIMIAQRFSVIEGENKVLKCYATLAPANMTSIAYAKIQDAANKIAKAFELKNTPLHIQVLINGEDISVIEFAPRVGGGISYQTILENTGFDMLEASVDSFLQIPVKQQYYAPKEYYSINIVYAKPGIFDRMTGAEELLTEGIIEHVFYHKTKGMTVTDDRASGGRIAAIIIKAKDKQVLLDKISLTMDKIQVYDVNGRPIMRKDLYLRDF